MTETIKDIPLDELHPFPDHPFGVRDDEAMQQTVESIKEYGVLVPAIARPREDGGYEIKSKESVQKRLEIGRQLSELEELRRTVAELPPEVLQSARKIMAHKSHER